MRARVYRALRAALVMSLASLPTVPVWGKGGAVSVPTRTQRSHHAAPAQELQAAPVRSKAGQRAGLRAGLRGSESAARRKGVTLKRVGAVSVERPRRRAVAAVRPVVAATAVEPHPLTYDDFVRAEQASEAAATERTAASDEPTVTQPTAEQLAALAHPSQQELAEEAVQPVVLAGLYRNGRLIVPPPLKGTHEILVHQNVMADEEGLERIRDEEDLQRLRAKGLLVNFPETAGLHVNPELAGDRRCARVWTVRFAEDISRQFYARFHQPLQVNSAVRTVAYQLRLQRTNGNAVGVGGEIASPHLTGQALDFGKSGMSVAEIAWMRAYLKPLMDSGKVDVEEEFQQACFHISVYRSYLPAVPARRRVAEVAQLR